jgi:hypothetical protein
MLQYSHMRFSFVSVLVSTFLLFVLPQVVSAQIVQCEGASCGTCELVEMANRILRWTISMMVVLSGVIIAVAGFKMVMSAGNMSAISDAREMITNVFVGLIILLASWLIVDTVMKVMVGTNLPGMGPWNTAQIQQQYGATISTYCQGSTITNCTNVVAALIAAESSGRTSVTSGAGAVGLMQLLPTNGGLNCAQTDTACINNQIQLGLQKLNNDMRRYGTLPLTLAAYNGGGAAVTQSGCCPSGYAYQCQYDCGGQSNYRQCTSVGGICTLNTGFVETRNYVNKICGAVGGC